MLISSFHIFVGIPDADIYIYICEKRTLKEYMENLIMIEMGLIRRIRGTFKSAGQTQCTKTLCKTLPKKYM